MTSPCGSKPTACAACGGSFYVEEARRIERVEGWDPRGTICYPCWEISAAEWIANKNREAWEQHERDLEECRG